MLHVTRVTFSIIDSWNLGTTPKVEGSTEKFLGFYVLTST